MVSCSVLPPPPLEAGPEPLPLDIVYEDEHLLVINKVSQRTWALYVLRTRLGVWPPGDWQGLQWHYTWLRTFLVVNGMQWLAALLHGTADFNG